MSRPRKLSDTEIAAAQVMRLADPPVPYKVIAGRFGVSERTIYYALEKELQKPVFAEQDDSPARENTP